MVKRQRSPRVLRHQENKDVPTARRPGDQLLHHRETDEGKTGRT